MQVTLILTRTPLKEFSHGRRSGRWGELVAFKGPKVSSARLLPKTPFSGGANPLAAVGQVAVSIGRTMAAALQGKIHLVPVNHGILELSLADGPVFGVQRFTSMERFKADSGNGYYVQLRPRPTPYGLTFEKANSAVMKLRPGHDGRCFRVHGGQTKPEKGILIHEAPEVGWVIGCIAPRPLNNFTIAHKNTPGNPSHKAMDELIAFVGARADLFVLDW
ncbi:MAG: hypothetical protein KIT83_08840 [Bryobacterales bacterium]|nr:hypothetical protein [Bryobacterales bacterium]